MSTPLIGRNAVIQYSSGTAVTIGYATGVTCGIKADLIKEFALGSQQAAILAQGNQSYSVECDMMYIDNTYSSLVIAGAPVDMIIGLAGTATGKVKITIKNVVFTAFDFKADQKGIITGKVSGEGNQFLTGTF
jgi:hypothetical protein